MKYRCLRCTGTTEASSLADAKNRIDHAIGLSKGRPCAGGDLAPVQLVDSVVTSKDVVEAMTVEKKPKKSEKSD